MSPIIPAQPIPILSVILKTFLATLLMTNVPYAYLRSEPRMAPSLHTSPTVVAPGMYMSSLIIGSVSDRHAVLYKASA